MTNKQQSKVRFVRCPKCSKILPEPEHVPLYTCGGCGTILQAKNYRGPQKNTALSSHEQNGVINARDGGESSGSSRRSSSDHTSAQEEGRNADGVESSRNFEQNGAASSSDNSSSSKDSSFKNKENGEIDDIKSEKIFSKSEQIGAENTSLPESSSFKNKENGEIDDSKSEGSCSRSEHNRFANYTHKTAFSEESGCSGNKEIEDTYRKIDQSDTKDRGANDHSTLLENEPRKIEDESGQDEECNEIGIENLHERQIGHVISDREVFTPDKSIKDEDEEDDDEHEERLVKKVKSAKDTSLLIESSPIENPAEHHASDHELSTSKVHNEGTCIHGDRHEQDRIGYMNSAKDASDHETSEDTRKVHNDGTRIHEDTHEQNGIGCMNTARNDSSWTESPGIEKPTQFGSENLAETNASDQQQSKEIKAFHLVERHSHQDVSRNEINLHDLDEPEAAKRGKEYGVGTDPIEDASESPGKHDAFSHEASKETSKMHLVEVHVQQDRSEKGINHLSAAGAEVEKADKENANGRDPHDIAEPLQVVEISSAHSRSTELTQGGNNESVRVSTSASAIDLKKSNEMGSTKVSFDNVEGTSKQNVENVGERAVYVHGDVGTFLKDIPDSSSKRSPAYDGSVSSFDGNDDKVAEQRPQVGDETLSPNNALAGSDDAEGSPEWNSLPSERMIFGKLRPQRPSRSSSSMVFDSKLKSRMIEEEGRLEGNGIPRRFRPNRENFLPRVPNRRRSSEMPYETGSTSSYALHDEVPRHRMHPHQPYGRRHPEASLWREKEFLPTYYNSETSGEFYDRPEHLSYMDRRRRTESWSQSGNLTRMPYSGEMFNGRYPYMHRYPGDRRWSAQLTPPAIYFHQGGYMNPNWETRWDPYDSYPTSPQRFMESDSSYAWGHDTISLSDDPRHKDQIMKRLYLKEKRQALKTPFHPIAGGTPFITCYICFHILQLPQDFLLSRRRRRRRTHKLKCGACSSILEFSLEKEGGLTPCEANLNKNANLAMPSHPQPSSSNSANGRVLLSQDSVGASNREKIKIEHGSSSNGERLNGLHDEDDAPPARGRPPKVTWQVPERSKSPLHKLMGYSSPNELLTFHEADVA